MTRSSAFNAEKSSHFSDAFDGFAVAVCDGDEVEFATT